MVPGHLQDKNGKYYIVLDLKNENGKRSAKWIATGLEIKGNKRKAEIMLQEECKKYTDYVPPKEADILFSDFLVKWLKIVEPKLAVTTYAGYENNASKIIIPYFKKKDIRLSKLSSNDLNEFYADRSKHVKQSTILHYHTLIHKALKYAVKNKYIERNPADDAERPKAEKFEGKFYNGDDLEKLFAAVKGKTLEIPVLFGAFYGLRRSEVVGLKWSAVDFQEDTITIRHTITNCYLNGKRVQISKDRTKNSSSLRTLPLVPQVKEWLGHSDFSTTANIYSHLEYKAKIASANTMAESMSKALSAIK